MYSVVSVFHCSKYSMWGGPVCWFFFHVSKMYVFRKCFKTHRQHFTHFPQSPTCSTLCVCDSHSPALTQDKSPGNFAHLAPLIPSASTHHKHLSTTLSILTSLVRENIPLHTCAHMCHTYHCLTIVTEMCGKFCDWNVLKLPQSLSINREWTEIFYLI